MICDECGKNQANFHFTQIIDGHKEEYNLCESCATKEYKSKMDESLFSMKDIFSNIMDGFQSDPNEAKVLKCNNCGMDYYTFRKNGKFGCSKCYETFKDKLPQLFKSIHGDNTHRGKIPSGISGEYRIYKERNELKYKMEDAVRKEEFEMAAELRDKLAKIDRKIEEGDY